MDAANESLTQSPSPFGESPSSGRDPQTGRFVANNNEALTHGARSGARYALQAALRAQIRQQIVADLGGDESALPTTVLGLIERFIEVSMLCDSYFRWLADQGGPIGTKGRQRAAVRGYLAALNAQIKLAVLIGLDRRARHTSFAEAVQAAVAAHAEDGDD